jgi:hypothetical protein
MEILCYTDAILIALLEIYNPFWEIFLLISAQITRELLGQFGVRTFKSSASAVSCFQVPSSSGIPDCRR